MRQIVAQILVSKYEEDRRRRWELEWQTKTLAQFIAAAAPMGDEEGSLLKAAEALTLELDFERKPEEEGDKEFDPSQTIVATPVGTPVQQDPALLELEEEDVKAIFEKGIKVNAAAIPEGSFERMVPDSVRFAIARQQAFEAAAKNNTSDT